MRTEINSYLGVPYRIGGLSMKGMDCSGLVWRVYHDAAGIELPRSSNNMHLIGESVQYGKWNFGDLLFFSINDKKITHVGIYIGANRFVHVSISDGTIISSLEEPYYEMSYKGARRIIR